MDALTQQQQNRNSEIVRCDVHTLEVRAGEDIVVEFGICEECKREVEYQELYVHCGICRKCCLKEIK